MGFGGISLWQLLIILLIVVVIFGTKKLGSIGSDLGGAVKGFRKAMGEAEKDEDQARIEKNDANFSDAGTDSAQSEKKSKQNS